MQSDTPRAAIVDYGMGNLFSVAQACEQAGLNAHITSQPSDVLEADAVILPGVGAFGDAMETLRERGLADALRAAVAAGIPFFGICLGLQLLMSESDEFGSHEGLDIISGRVRRFETPGWKVPHVGWTPVRRTRSWQGESGGVTSPLAGLPDGACMYLIHSFDVVRRDPSVTVTTSEYADIEFCSSVQSANVFGCQFHPERSERDGLHMYRNFAAPVRAAVAPAREL